MTFTLHSVQYVEKEEVNEKINLSDVEVLRQVTDGLDYLHNGQTVNTGTLCPGGHSILMSQESNGYRSKQGILVILRFNWYL